MVQCYDCYEGPVIILYTGKVSEVQKVTNKIMENGNIEIEGFGVLPIIGKSEPSDAIIDEIESNGFDVIEIGN